jgi:DNA-binding CsgD family transcriptional regulator
MGVEEPGRFRFLPDEIEALIQLGRLDDADAWIEWLTARATTLRRDWAIAAADRCRALLLEASGTEAGATFEAAVRGHEGLPDAFERARTLYAYGAYLRRRRRKAAAREVLDEAASLFRQLGARAWSARADEELARIGGRAATRSTLTPTERRIAERVASGRTNVEVARELFVSPKTVEWNLSKIYRKLMVRSRAELAAKLANAPAAK